jgi:integrase
MEDVVRAKRPRRVPVVLSRGEVERVLAALDGVYWLMAGLLYGSGMRLMECLRLRVKDVDFARNEITVREGKGRKDRRVPLPAKLVDALQRQIARSGPHRNRENPAGHQPLGRFARQVSACKPDALSAKAGDMDFAGSGARVTGGETQPIVATMRSWAASWMMPRMCSRSLLRRG